MPVPRRDTTAVVSLTVVVPAYNEERRLRPGIDAICHYLRRSGERNWELIVVDDGSTDRTAAVAAARQQRKIGSSGSAAVSSRRPPIA